jgi:hypothetical protein
MLLRSVLSVILALFAAVFLQACTSARQIVLDYPKTETTPIKPLKGESVVNADDYYVQLVSEFDFKGDNDLKGACSDVGTQYEKGDLSAALIFNIHNEPLKLKSEVSGFLYQAAIGKCNVKLETKKAYLTPWLRLDSARDTQVDYNFLTSNSHEANLSQVVGDVNAASNLLALTGVGVGVAVVGKIAGNWMESNQQLTAKTPADAKISSETHSLPSVVTLSGDSGNLNQSRLGVYEVGSGTKLLGELHIYPNMTPSLLLKIGSDGIPDAHDLSLEELWRAPMQSANGQVQLSQLIEQAGQTGKLNLTPDWQNYAEVENQCRRLKLTMKDLGFNKFDRNAVLYYFLSKSPDWKNFNITPQRAMTDEIRPKLLEQYHSNDFAACLAGEDYQVMKNLKLPVNDQQAWEVLSNSRQKKESLISPILSTGRQLLSALNNPDKDEMARQLYPLLNTDKGGNGSVLVQNHLSNFGLEALLQVPNIPDEGVIANSAQLAGMFIGLNVDSYSCSRPGQEQGQPLSNIGILLFTTKPNSPKEKGGALEFELVQGKIGRLSFQTPAFRDFEQNLTDYPDLGGCRIDKDFLNKLH